MKTIARSLLLLVGLGAILARAASPFPMASGNFFENFTTVSNWAEGFTSPLAATHWSGLQRNPGVGIPNPTNVLTATTNFANSGVQPGTNNLILFASGPMTDNTNSVAVDLLLDFTACLPGRLSFAWSPVFINVGDRTSSLRVYAATNTLDFTELPGAAVLNVSNNVVTSGVVTGIALPAWFSNAPTARLRFYVYNGTGGSTGNRARIAIDDVAVTGTRLLADVTTQPATGMSNTVATLRATVAPGTLPATAWFEWGLFPGNNTNRTSPVSLGSGATPVAISNTVAGLAPGLIHYGRIVASNAVGLVRGRLVQFGAPGPVFDGFPFRTNECHFPFTDTTTLLATPLALTGGDGHSLALQSDGSVAAWGANYVGQTAVPAGVSNVVAVAAAYFHNLALRRDGTVVSWGQNEFGKTNVPAGLSNVVAVAGGSGHSLALKDDGTVVAWGWNLVGQTNTPAGLSNVVAIAAGDSHSLALQDGGTVVAWGNNGSSQTDVPPGLNNVVAISAGLDFSLALKSDGTIAAWGKIFGAPVTIPADASNVVAMASGEFHYLLLKNDGTLIAWGNNFSGETDLPPGLGNVVAIGAGGAHNFAMRRDGAITSWGWNQYGQTNVPAGLSTLPMSVTGSVNTNAPGSYPFHYASSNVLGGVANLTRTVIVADTIPPVVTLLGINPILLTNAAQLPLVDPGAMADDLCSGSLPVVVSNAVNVNFPGPYAITYRATDASGNMTVVNRSVIVALPPAAPAVPGDQNGDGLVSQAELDAVYAAYLPTSPWLQMTNVAGLGGQRITFSLSNSTLGAYTVEYTTNFAGWFPLGPATPRYEFTDTNAPALPQRYYRLRHP